jgi:hypothetical protein
MVTCSRRETRAGAESEEAMATELAIAERRQLADCERRIKAGLKTFQEVGSALLEIQANRLYRQDYKTFEAYCRDKWQLPKRTAYHYIDQAKAVNSVPSLAQSGASASAIEELVKLPETSRADAWEEIQRLHGEHPTAEQVSHYVDLVTPDDDPAESPTIAQDATDDEEASEDDEAEEDAGDGGPSLFNELLEYCSQFHEERCPETSLPAFAAVLESVADKIRGLV